jgi:hypothetical protein
MQFGQLKRREVITLLGGVVGARPIDCYCYIANCAPV